MNALSRAALGAFLLLLGGCDQFMTKEYVCPHRMPSSNSYCQRRGQTCVYGRDSVTCEMYGRPARLRWLVRSYMPGTGLTAR